MRLIQRLAVVAFAFFLFVVIRNVQAQGCVTSGPVRIIENPAAQPQSACVIPFGSPDPPPIGHRNWDIIIIHDPIAIPGLSNQKTYQIWTNRPGIDSINSITIVSKNNAASGRTIISIAPPPGDRFVNVGSVAMTTDSTGLVIVDSVAISGNFIGPLYAHRFNLVADGDLAGDVFLASHSSQVSNLQVLVGGDITSEFIQVSTSQSGIPGYIERLNSTNGSIGTPNHMVYVLADGSLWNVRAGYINAYMGGLALSGIDSFVQGVRRIETYTTGGHSGIFTGYIDAQRVEDSDAQANWFSFAGPMQGVIRLGYGFDDASANPNARNYMQVPAGGMQGQVIMRALGGDDGETPWLRPVHVGQQTSDDDLNPKPSYSETSGQIGGGAVGRVPYATHFTDCVPVFFATPGVFPTQNYGDIDQDSPIKIRHYGPVLLPIGARAFGIERRMAGGSGPWLDETDCFTESLDANPTVVLLRPSRALQVGYEYRVIQTLNDGVPSLTCDGVVVPSTPPPVALFGREFRFTVCGPSLGDADNSGCVDFGDTTKVLEQWGSTSCLKDGDANRDGSVDFGDITAVLTHWLAAYCGECAQSFARGSVPTIADGLNALGYEHLDAFLNDLQMLPLDEQPALIRQLLDASH